MQGLGSQGADHPQYTEEHNRQKNRIQRRTTAISRRPIVEGDETYGEYEYLPSTSVEFILAHARIIWLTV